MIGQHDASTVVADAAAQLDAASGACGMPFSGVLATWNFSAQPGTEASAAASSTAHGVTAGAFTRSSTITAMSGSGSINSNNWTTSSQLGATRYYTLSLGPPSGCTLDLTSISIDSKSSSTGPSAASIATSADSFAHVVAVTTNSVSTPTLSVSGAAASVELRIYGYAAGGTSGTMRVENTFTVSGSVQ